MCFVLRNICKSGLMLTCMKQNLKMGESTKRPFTILVEGNIGSGKTTFLDNFRNNKNILTVYEPINEWKNLNGYNLLKLFYDDIKTWSFTFQSYVLLTMIKAHELKTERHVKMIERSIYSGRYVFIENLAKIKMISQPDLSVLDEWFNWLIQSHSTSVDLIVYLRTEPEVAYKRVQKRARSGENTLSLEYLEQLHKCHEEWLLGKNRYICPAPVVVLNANKDIETIKDQYKFFENQIKIDLVH